MRRMCSFLQVQNKLILCSCVSRIAVCRCPAVPRCPCSARDDLRQTCMRTLWNPLEQSEASSCARRWSSMHSTLQTIEAPCGHATRVSRRSIPQSAAFCHASTAQRGTPREAGLYREWLDYLRLNHSTRLGSIFLRAHSQACPSTRVEPDSGRHGGSDKEPAHFQR